MPAVSAIPELVTVEQYRQLPDDRAHLYELHYGEIVEVSRPKIGHVKLQLRLMRLLEHQLLGFGKATTGFPYRALPEFELRASDVVFVAQERWDATDDDDNLHGAPELVIEVKTLSKPWAELRALAALCLANGSREFWIADEDKRTMAVIQHDGSTAVYEPGQEIPLRAFGAESIAVNAIFEES